MSTPIVLPGAQLRSRYMRMDAANVLKRFFFAEQSLIVAQAGWLGWIQSLEVKTTLPRFIWEDALTANALRERVFELRFPSRLLEVGSDSPVVGIFDEAINAPGPEAFVLSLGRVLVPALRDAYQTYARDVDEIADGPTLRFLRVAIDEKTRQIAQLEGLSARMLAEAPERRAEAEAWVAALSGRLAEVGGVSLVPQHPAEDTPELPGRRPFKLAEIPASEESYHQCRFYWPDIVEPDVPYGEGLLLQIRTAVSHLNEVWAVETAGDILCAFAGMLGWEFVLNAARWTYDESRHCRMGIERLKQWGFDPAELPLGTYIYDSARGQNPVYRLGLLYYFETKNIGKKNERAQTFAGYQDQVSQHDMEFDWADETMHAHYGNHWLKALHSLNPQAYPGPDEVRSRCEALVQTMVDSATAAERADIRQVAEFMIAKAQRIAASG